MERRRVHDADCGARSVELAGDDSFSFPEDVGEASLPRMYRGLGLAGATVLGRLGRQGAFGASNSARAFGHDGVNGQMGWGDPESGISLGFVTNSMDMGPTGVMKMDGFERKSALADLANLCVLDEPAAGSSKL